MGSASRRPMPRRTCWQALAGHRPMRWSVGVEVDRGRDEGEDKDQESLAKAQVGHGRSSLLIRVRAAGRWSLLPSVCCIPL